MTKIKKRIIDNSNGDEYAISLLAQIFRDNLKWTANKQQKTLESTGKSGQNNEKLPNRAIKLFHNRAGDGLVCCYMMALQMRCMEKTEKLRRIEKLRGTKDESRKGREEGRDRQVEVFPPWPLYECRWIDICILSRCWAMLTGTMSCN